ncbi:YqzG/YhdC family protein [Effusibacillus consociatus]|uniref:YqzG/YhdC family protein n=1 Tax=Effusibacillus consociatus TaxID=1117041 RepID=A0ABV9Q774_9BACL
MKRSLVWTILVTVLVCFPFPISVQNSSYAATQAQPPYAKWGRLAMAETMKKYPGASIVDYLHVGRSKKSPTTSEETFKLWLRKGTREWGVYVRILFETSTERLISITFEETTRS